MSSMSAQGVVERASAELSKRINGLGLRSKHHKDHGTKTSVMERVTNVFCGGNNSNITSSPSDVLEKPSRLLYAARGKISTINGASAVATPNLTRKNRLHPSSYVTWEQLILDERFLVKFFGYFTAFERRTLAQVSEIYIISYHSSASNKKIFLKLNASLEILEGERRVTKQK